MFRIPCMYGIPSFCFPLFVLNVNGERTCSAASTHTFGLDSFLQSVLWQDFQSNEITETQVQNISLSISLFLRTKVYSKGCRNAEFFGDMRVKTQQKLKHNGS